MQETDIELQEGEALFKQFSMVIDNGQQPLRIDKFLMNRIEGATRNKIQQAIENGMVTVNGKSIKNNYKIKPADELIVFTDEEPDGTDIIPEEMPLNIFYEDDDILLINKPPGLVVHPGSGNPNGTLVNGVAYYLQQKNPTITDKLLPRFGLVHRIDKNTSGLLLMAKTEAALKHLAKQFFHHNISRKYVALVWGDVENDSGTIRAHVAETPATASFLRPTPPAKTEKKPLPITKFCNVSTTPLWWNACWKLAVRIKFGYT